MIGVAVSFDVNAAGGAVDGEVEGVVLFAGGQVLFALGGDAAALEGGPEAVFEGAAMIEVCLLYTSPSPRD